MRQRGVIPTFFFTLALTLVACDPNEEPPQQDDEPVPLAVDCSFFYLGETQLVRATDPHVEDPNPVLEFGSLRVGMAYFDDPYDGRSFSIAVYTEDGVVGSNTLYQVDRTVPLLNQFVGDHGFTGLHYVSDPGSDETLQYVCFAHDPDDAPSGWE
jgi:hypothetical protein